MKLTIFAKKRQTKEGRTYYVYLTALTKKDGTVMNGIAAKFNDCPVPKPEECPLIIEVEKSDANLSAKKYTDAAGIEKMSHTLWISQWMRSAEIFQDHSLDDFI